MITEQDLEVIVRHVIDAFQRGKFKAMLPPIRAEINSLKSVGKGYSLVDGKQGELLTLRGLLPGKFISMKIDGSDVIISLVGLPDISTVHFQNLRGVSVNDAKELDLLCFCDGAWRPITIDDFETIKALKTLKSYPDEDKEKLHGIQAGAQVNPDAKEIKTLYESNADTNAFTNKDKVVIGDLVVKAHSHKNREILDEYTVKNDDVKRAADAAHIHPNAENLNKITDPGSGRIITTEEREALQEIIALLPAIKKLL